MMRAYRTAIAFAATSFVLEMTFQAESFSTDRMTQQLPYSFAENAFFHNTPWKCPRKGSARIRIGQQVFVIPRLILGQVEDLNGKTDHSWRCSDEEFIARNFFINVTPTYAGGNFYRQWVEERKLPHTIEIAARGWIKRFSSDRFASLISRGAGIIKDPLGYRAIETAGQTFYEATDLGVRGFENHVVVFVCSEIANPRDQVVCHTNYHLDRDLDVTYRFSMPPNTPEQWPDLDRRTREFVRSLYSKVN